MSDTDGSSWRGKFPYFGILKWYLLWFLIEAHIQDIYSCLHSASALSSLLDLFQYILFDHHSSISLILSRYNLLTPQLLLQKSISVAVIVPLFFLLIIHISALYVIRFRTIKVTNSCSFLPLLFHFSIHEI